VFMNGIKKVLSLFLAGLLLCSLLIQMQTSEVTAHSGGTDKNGCHGGSQPFHCHGGSSDASWRKYLKVNGLQQNLSFKIVMKRFKSCASLNRTYIRGVAKTKKRNMDYTQLVSKPLYALNRHLDVNKNGIACGLLEPENGRITTNLCNTATPPLGDGSSPTTPLQCIIPPRGPNEIGGGWLIELISTTPDALRLIQTEYGNNEIPTQGSQYYLIRFRVTNISSTTNIFLTSRIKTLGVSGTIYDNKFECGTGLIPDALWLKTIIDPGKSAVGNLCWEVKSEDVAGLLAFYETQVSCNCNMYNFIDRRAFVSFQ
jgi:hypothetical protein